MPTTTMTRWRPFSEFAELRHRLDQMFEDVMRPEIREWRPDIDLIEEDGGLLLRADVPGIKPEEIEIEVENGILTICGAHEERAEEEREEAGQRYVRRERRYGSFSRSLTLPANTPVDKIEATCQDGVLEVRIPMPPEKATTAVRITPKAQAATGGTPRTKPAS